MKAAVFREIGKPLEVVDHVNPEPAPNEIVIKVGRCGICGSDLHMTEEGGRPPKAGAIIGHEISGEVVELGKGVTNLKVGDLVAALPISGCGKCAACVTGEPSWCINGLNFLGGGYAQYARAGGEGCLKLPGELGLDDGALVEPLAVALHGARMVPGISGSTVLVMGAGPIGLGAVYWARRFGASRIDVIEGNPQRARLAIAMGADSTTPPDTVAQAEGTLLKPAMMPEYVFECVGKPGLLTEAILKVRPRGTVISLGFCMSPEQIVAALAGMKEVTMKFPILYTLKDFQITLDALNAGSLEPRAMITETISLGQLPTVFESLRKPTHQCKVMVDPWRD